MNTVFFCTLEGKKHLNNENSLTSIDKPNRRHAFEGGFGGDHSTKLLQW
jgi:hypothetical protein